VPHARRYAKKIPMASTDKLIITAIDWVKRFARCWAFVATNFAAGYEALR